LFYYSLFCNINLGLCSPVVDAFGKHLQKATINFVTFFYPSVLLSLSLSTFPSVRMELPETRWTDFCKI